MESQALFHAGLLTGATWALLAPDRSGYMRLTTEYPRTCLELVTTLAEFSSPTLAVVRIAMGRPAATRRQAEGWLAAWNVDRPLLLLDERQFALGFIAGVHTGMSMALAGAASLAQFAGKPAVPRDG